jgi:hypothetical protein
MGNSLSFPLNEQSNSLSHKDQVPLPYWEIGRGVRPNQPEAFFFRRRKRRLPSVSTTTPRSLDSNGPDLSALSDHPTRARRRILPTLAEAALAACISDSQICRNSTFASPKASKSISSRSLSSGRRDIGSVQRKTSHSLAILSCWAAVSPSLSL